MGSTVSDVPKVDDSLGELAGLVIVVDEIYYRERI